MRQMPDQQEAASIRSTIVDVLATATLPSLEDRNLTMHTLLDSFLIEHGNPDSRGDKFSSFISEQKAKFTADQKLDAESVAQLQQALDGWLTEKLGHEDGKVIAVLALQQALVQRMARSASLSDYQTIRRASEQRHVSTIFVGTARESAVQQLQEKMTALQPAIADFQAQLKSSASKTLAIDDMQSHLAKIAAPLNEILDAFLEDSKLLQGCIEKNPDLTLSFIENIPSAFAPRKKEQLQKSQGFFDGNSTLSAARAYDEHQANCARAGLNLVVDE